MAMRRSREKNITGGSKDLSRRGKGLNHGKSSRKKELLKKLAKKAALAIFESLAK